MRRLASGWGRRLETSEADGPVRGVQNTIWRVGHQYAAMRFAKPKQCEEEETNT